MLQWDAAAAAGAESAVVYECVVVACVRARRAVGRPGLRQAFVKRSASTVHDDAARSPSVPRHAAAAAAAVRRAPSFRPEDISTPTLQSSTNSLLALAADVIRRRLAERRQQAISRPPRAESTDASDGRRGTGSDDEQLDVSSASSSSFCSAVDDSEERGEAGRAARAPPPRPRHALNKVKYMRR